MIAKLIESADGKKTIVSTALIVLYFTGLLREWWPRNLAVEGFLGTFFSVGVGDKVRKRRRHKREAEIAYRNDPHSDDPRRYESVEDLLDRED